MSAATDNVPVASRTMKQAAIHWPFTGVDDFGQPTYGSPEEIACRWDTVNEEFITPSGDQEVSRARLIVDRDIAVKDRLALGELDSLTPEDPKDQDGAWEVRSFNKTPNFKGTKFLREVFL